jgi:C4-dicarboxylate-specific signal transduction histidine kinase
MNTEVPTQEQIAKLPQWAQRHIETLDRQREAALRALRQFTDEQTASPFSFDEHACIGNRGPDTFTRFVQARVMTVSHAGVMLTVRCWEPNEIGLQWGAYDEGGPRSRAYMQQDEVAFVPASFQSARLVAHQHMRTR